MQQLWENRGEWGGLKVRLSTRIKQKKKKLMNKEEKDREGTRAGGGERKRITV